MRILLVNTSPHWGGGEAWALETTVALQRRAHVVGIAAAAGDLATRARDAGVPVVRVPCSPLGRWSASRRLRAWITALAPDIAIANAGPDVRRMAWLLQGQRAARVLRRGLDRPLSRDAWHRSQYRRLDAILTNSEATRRTVVASCNEVPAERVAVVHNGIDVEAFERFTPLDVRAQLGIPSAAFVLGIVGRLTRQKGHAIAFEAFERVRAERPDARLLVVGDGEEEPALRRHPGATHARFLGSVHPVQPYYEACDVIVLPSWFEGFCYVAAEAGILQRPVIAADASSLPEVVRHHETGLLVPPGDVAAFASAILALAADPIRRTAMGQRARAHVRARFDIGVVVPRLESFLREACAWAASRSS